MTEAQAVEAISKAWLVGFGALHPEISLDVLDNEAASAAGIDTWVRMTVVPSTRVQATMGGAGTRRFETRGRIAVELYTDVDKGAAAAWALADDTRKVLESAALPQRDANGNAIAGGESVDTFGGGSPQGPTTDGRWLRLLVLIPFVWWEQR